ncbi:DnaJ domain-containing protein [Desulfosoma sp.]
MMTRKEALQVLGLPENADRESVERAYRRLARRYPPELQPDRFRRIDVAYRHLISLAERLETALQSSTGKDKEVDLDIFRSLPALPDETFEKALCELRTLFVLDILFPPSKKS